nr:hypothetical protein [uncultured Treponema sp.]
MKNFKNKLIYPIIACFIFLSCKNEYNMIFSFKGIQDSFYLEFEKIAAPCFNPFYSSVNKEFFNNIECQLNELIKESDYCSVLIRSSIDNGILEVAAIFNTKDAVWFKMWDDNGFEIQSIIQDKNVKKKLKSRPSDTIIIDSNIVLDGTSYYVIKKIYNKTYFYANHHMHVNDNFKPLVDLFNEMMRKSYSGIKDN